MKLNFTFKNHPHALSDRLYSLECISNEKHSLCERYRCAHVVPNHSFCRKSTVGRLLTVTSVGTECLMELKLIHVCLLEHDFGKNWAVFVQTHSMSV